MAARSGKKGGIDQARMYRRLKVKRIKNGEEKGKDEEKVNAALLDPSCAASISSSHKKNLFREMNPNPDLPSPTPPSNAKSRSVSDQFRE